MSDRKAVEDLWHQRLRGVKLRLEAAQQDLHEFLRENPFRELSSPDGHYAYRQAIRAERLALQEYARVRRIYDDLMVRGIIPDEDVLGKEAGADE